MKSKAANRATPRREPQFPTRWIRTDTDSGPHYARIVGGTKRDSKGRKLYRLRHLAYDVMSRKMWTQEEIRALNPRFLRKRPAAQWIERTK